MQVFLAHSQTAWADLVKPLDILVADGFGRLGAPFHAAVTELFSKADVAVGAPADQFQYLSGYQNNIF